MLLSIPMVVEPPFLYTPVKQFLAVLYAELLTI